MGKVIGWFLDVLLDGADWIAGKVHDHEGLPKDTLLQKEEQKDRLSIWD